jgi:4-carboxymuconolactone decarboxylase
LRLATQLACEGKGSPEPAHRFKRLEARCLNRRIGKEDKHGKTAYSSPEMGDIAPSLADLTDRVLFGEVWERTELSKRDRSLVTVAALVAMNRPDQLRFHLNRAVENGVTKEELIEAITHLAFYSGWPNAASAILVAKEVFSNA